DTAGLISAVYTADIAVMMLGIGLGTDGLQYQIEPQALERLGLDDAAFQALLLQVMPAVQEAESFLAA
ncbi:MAG TPA: hypothetical protein PK954_01355, partial [Anaerolineales bacterium]|nr:hypothetical protein [Anaerolineales bacterium]